MDFATIASRTLWGLVIGVLGLLTFFLTVPDHMNRSANESAEAFCNSVVIGESIRAVREKAQSHGVVLTISTEKNGIIDHQAMFRGFLLSAYTCDIKARLGVVISKETEAWE